MLCPEWIDADFAQTKTGKDISAYVRAAFPKTRGRPKGENKGGGDPDYVPALLKD